MSLAVIGEILGKKPAEIAHGWMFIGYSINILLLGVMTTQVYIYYGKYKSDKLWIKLFVATLYLTDIVNISLMFAFLYNSLIVYWGNIQYLSMANWLLAAGDPATTAIIAMAVQFFFAWRVLVLTETWYWATAVVAIGIVGGVGGILTAVNLMRHPDFADSQKLQVYASLWLAGEAVADVVITSVLVWYLRKHKTGFTRSDQMVDRIIRLTVQTGLLTMVVAVFDLGFFLPQEHIHSSTCPSPSSTPTLS